MAELESMNMFDRCLLHIDRKELSSGETNGKFYKVWAWFPDNVIKELKAAGLIRIIFGSLFLTQKGKRKAHELKNRYFG